MRFDGLKYHVPRVAHALGRPLLLGTKKYRLAGYHADRIAHELRDEAHLRPLIRRILAEQKGVFLDVGANCGQTLFKVLSIDPSRQYIGFEPQIDCCFYLEQFRQMNGLSNVTVLPVALSDRDAVLELFVGRPADVAASLLKNQFNSTNQRSRHSRWVMARKGDDLVSEMEVSDISALKIDVEGFELEVINGLRDTIKTFRPVIMFEVLTNRVWGRLIDDECERIRKQDRANAIFRTLRDLQYSVFRIDSDGNEHRIEAFDLDGELGTQFRNDGRDYVARLGY